MKLGPYGGMELPGHSQGRTFDAVSPLGARLSLELDCPVRWPGFQKNMFTCYHGYSVAVFRLKSTEDWLEFIAEHKAFIGGLPSGKLEVEED